jgi:DNA-directed RNA polymerase specialized sigma subunit
MRPLEACEAELPQAVMPERVALPRQVLTGRQRLVLHLLFDRGMDVPGVAKLLAVEEQTVRSAKHKAIVRLRRHFEERTETRSAHPAAEAQHNVDGRKRNG